MKKMLPKFAASLAVVCSALVSASVAADVIKIGGSSANYRSICE